MDRLNYLTVTRLDITFAVGVLSQFLKDPTDSQWNATIRILRYIKNAPGPGLLYEDKGNGKVVCYFDADWPGSPSDKSSTSGYSVFMGENLISWRSKKQKIVARFSAEAECRVMAAAASEITWLRQLLQQIKFGDV